MNHTHLSATAIGQGNRFRSAPTDEVNLNPASTYEALMRQMVEQLQTELQEIKGRLNGLLWMVAGTLLVDVMSKFFN